MKEKKPIVLDSWLGGKYFDWWMVLHFLGGFVIELSLLLLGLKMIVSSIITLLVLVLWEIYEYKKLIYEPISNKIIDIIVGLIGIGASIWVFKILENVSFVVVLASAFLIWAVLGIWGWQSWQERVKSE